MKIIDNYLSEIDSDRITQYLTENSNKFPVYFRRDVSKPGSDDGMYFIHNFDTRPVNSPTLQVYLPSYTAIAAHMGG